MKLLEYVKAMLVFVTGLNQQRIISPFDGLGSLRAIYFVAPGAELDPPVRVTGITPKGFARHCNPGLTYCIMRKFLFLILGTRDWATAKELVRRNRWENLKGR